MAQIDSGIYLQSQAPDIFGGVSRGLQMSDMLRKRKKDEEDLAKAKQVEEAYAAGRVQNPDGTISLDRAAVLSKLSGIGAGKEAYAIQDQIDAQARSQAKAHADAAALKFDQNLKERELKLKEREMRAKEMAPGAKLSEGQKTVDREFAKDYNDWTSGGAKIASSEIQKLKAVAANLRNKNVTTGGLTGFFPDRMTSNEVLQARADVQSTVMNSLRAILGAQFTEKEGERIIKNTWNEADSTENNLARINRLVGDLEAKALDKTNKAKFYEQNRSSLAGYSPVSSVANQAPMSVRVIAPDGSVRLIPENQVQAAIQSGGRLADGG